MSSRRCNLRNHGTKWTWTPEGSNSRETSTVMYATEWVAPFQGAGIFLLFFRGFHPRLLMFQPSGLC